MKRKCEITAEAALIPAGPDSCPVDIAKKRIDAALGASCGRGVICRDGLSQLSCILEDILRGRGNEHDAALIKDICNTAIVFNECDITVRLAEDLLASLEKDATVWDRHIGGKVCEKLICFFTVHIDAAKCTGCGRCRKVCAKNCIRGGDGLIHIVDWQDCNRCLLCMETCQENAFIKAGVIKPRCPINPVPVSSFSEAAGMRKRRKVI